ncbi:MAG TPA: substrate-binding domain-containing protein [Fimbriimonas sp.]|nr:substrate-binding domain-containing protein [Fimbriimonas sp.]
MRIWKTPFLALLAVAGLIGCNGGGSETPTANGTTGTASTNGGAKSYTIVVIPKGATHEYWRSVHEGANTAASELKDVNIDWEAPTKEDDREMQIQIVENAINKKVDGIVLAPLDAQALAKPVAEAGKAGIPVVIIDSGLKGDADFVSYIATDNEKGGMKAADELSKALNGKGNVVMLRYEEGSASTEDREKGFLEEIAKSPGIKVVSSDQHGGVTADSAMKASENLLAPHKKGDGLDIDGIYTPNESTTTGMLRALEELKVAGKVKLVGFDASEALLNGLKSGEIDGLIIQNPRKMGYNGVKTLEAYIKGDKGQAKTVDTGATLLTKDKLSDPEIQKLIAPPTVQ